MINKTIPLTFKSFDGNPIRAALLLSSLVLPPYVTTDSNRVIQPLLHRIQVMESTQLMEDRLHSSSSSSNYDYDWMLRLIAISSLEEWAVHIYVCIYLTMSLYMFYCLDCDELMHVLVP